MASGQRLCLRTLLVAFVSITCCSAEVCDKPPVTGSCSSATTRYTYNSTLDSCFEFRGCKLDGNNFDDEEQCTRTCGVDICSLEVDKGQCLAIFPRYFFNVQTDTCEPFTYGGCPGNANRFSSLDACERRCKFNRCTLPLDPGPCRGSFKRYYYNEDVNECQRFTYGGCKGNRNNFQTLEDCRSKCVDTCSLPPDTGPCRASFPRYFFNIQTNTCQKFTYGGCRGNANRFTSLDACERRCKSNRCTLPLDPGPCRASFGRYYYNEDLNECKRFTYGGCKGNRNNFHTLRECQGQCVDICSLPANTGPCRAYIPSYFFNVEADTCQQFTYGGCLGNANRFSSLDACERRCKFNRCTLPLDIGPCRGSVKRYYYNEDVNECQRFTYGGCKGNRNNFQTLEDCRSKCVDICSLPPDTGPCRASFTRYFFNIQTNTCQQFTYGGCRGNANRFTRLDACERRCKSNRCTLPLDPGPCRASFGRYYYNEDLNECKRFTYGGCKGNRNNFHTLRECQEQCVDICSLPANIGPCYAYIPSYFFNGQTEVCEPFIYGGCLGNANRFTSLDECEQRCKRALPVCDQPANTGPCKAHFPRYFFNKLTSKCEVFIYGGCEGNSNNFVTELDCVRTCACKLPIKVGCSGRRGYQYNPQRHTCDRVPNVCDGGFRTRTRCKRTCISTGVPTARPITSLLSLLPVCLVSIRLAGN